MLKKAIRSISLLLALVILIAAIPLHTSAAEEPFLVGACCHPTNEYVTNWDDIVYYTAKMGGKIIRMDLQGTNAERWDKFFALCKAYGVEVQGIVYNTTTAEWFSKRYGNQIKYMQILNERDAYCLTGGGAGMDKGAYNMNKIAEIAAELKDIIAVVRENAPKTKIIVNMTWTHYGFIEHMIEQDVEFDVVGLDWYSNQESYGLTNALDDLKERFGKPIFICEANIWANSGDGGTATEEIDKNMGATNIKLIDICKAKQKSHQIVGYTVYELLNENTKRGNTGAIKGEAYFGLIYLKSDLTIDKPKAAYYELQEYLGYKNNNIKKIPISSLDLTQYGPDSIETEQPSSSEPPSSETSSSELSSSELSSSELSSSESSSSETTSSETSSSELSSSEMSSSESSSSTSEKNTIVETITTTQTEVITEVKEVVDVVYEEPETIETVKTKNIYKTKGFPVWLIIEIVGCVLVTAGVIIFFVLRKKKKLNFKID